MNKMITLSIKSPTPLDNTLKGILTKFQTGQIWRVYNNHFNYIFMVIDGREVRNDLRIFNGMGYFSLVNLGSANYTDSVGGLADMSDQSILHRSFFEYVGMIELKRT